MEQWLIDFQLTQPSEYFLDHPTDDYELACNVQSEREFLLSTLEIFGLPSGYMKGAGHFADWGKEKKDDKMAAAKRKAIASKMKQKKKNDALTRLKKERDEKRKTEEQRPTHFDLAPFSKAFK
mmetsp:Transcript_42304/g.30976  ORF Transcript_42304/g.30976 Transcript_42304/m.30976 type:complete len:123 (+) Transcript_42304:1035-1403(+)